jgi:hypothetical protein
MVIVVIRTGVFWKKKSQKKSFRKGKEYGGNLWLQSRWYDVPV